MKRSSCKAFSTLDVVFGYRPIGCDAAVIITKALTHKELIILTP